MKNVVILGSTGNLGVQTLEVLSRYKDDFRIVGLSAFENAALLKKQAKALKIKKENMVLASHDGKRKLNALAKLKEAEIIINVLAGTAGIVPTKIALRNKKIVLLGNKESLVADGKKIMELAKTSTLISLDSEHNAITEILKLHPQKNIKKIIIPCSGGALYGRSKKQIEAATLKDILSHPKWTMGAKITIESATWINKGMEVIEAHYLFNLPLKKIEVLVHPACEVHGIVEFTDNTNFAYISKPDMREHIENALRQAIQLPPKALRIHDFPQDPLQNKKYKFFLPDHKTFPGIKLVLSAFKKHPHKMKEFLKREEGQVNKFITGKLSFESFIFKNDPN